MFGLNHLDYIFLKSFIDFLLSHEAPDQIVGVNEAGLVFDAS
jgi:hypothetical protein